MMRLMSTVVEGLKNRLVIRDVHSSDESPPPTKTESDFDPGNLLGFQPERPDLRTPFKKSEKHTRHYPVEMTPGAFLRGNDYLGWLLKSHPNYQSMSSREFIARRGVELVNKDVFSSADILKNVIRRNFRKLQMISDGESFPRLQGPDSAAIVRFDRILDDTKKDKEYRDIFSEIYS